MTQLAQAGNPNFPPNGPEQHTADPYEFFTVDNIQQLRDTQKQARREEMASVDPFNPTERKDAEIRAAARYEQIRQEYMDGFDYTRQLLGLDPSDPAYDEYETILDHLGHVSIDQMNDDEWEYGQVDKDGNRATSSGKEMVDEMHTDQLNQRKADEAARATTTAANPLLHTPNNDPTVISEQMREELDRKLEKGEELMTALHGARDKLAELALKRQSKLVGSEASDEYKEAHEAYRDAMVEYGKFREEIKGEQRTDEEKNQTVIAYLLEEGSRLRDLTNEKWQNTKVGKVCKFLASGSMAERIVKGAGLGIVVAGGAAVLTAATAGTGALGAAAGGGATLATVASRIMRGYGAIRGRQGGMASELSPAEVNELVQLVATSVNGMDIGGHFMGEKYEDTVDNERRKNKKAALMSLGAVALGAGVTQAVHTVGEYIFDAYTDKDVLQSRNPGQAPGGTGLPEGTAPGGGEKGSVPPPSVEGGSNASGNAIDHITAEQYKAMTTVDKGMGGIELFKEMGLGQSDWYRHEQALLRAHPGDFYEMKDGHVGLKHPGKLSEGTMRDIAHRTGIWRNK